ncbi:hypothetical protein CMV_001954 [Castanea mollissima]|uniref:Uncharacterized protein n=1 Tax=Castanea mollissima TaxID=60419 RepID=A0A8J4W409_9ROSI|nr:hypothetical protein CMV_001954 [Castanea mollissima]
MEDAMKSLENKNLGFEKKNGHHYYTGWDEIYEVLFLVFHGLNRQTRAIYLTASTQGAGVVEKVELEVEIKEYKYEELVKALENFKNSFARQEAYDGGALVVEQREE